LNIPQRRHDRHELAGLTATELVQLYRTGQASPVEATSAVFARIDRHNDAICAFVHLDPEAAAQAAVASEARWRAGQPLSALDGVPVSIKDLILTQGMPTLRGSLTIDADQAWDVDAPATARLREAGAVILGKTATPEFGCKGTTASRRHGVTRNPWMLSRTPGGSSGGAAAALAAQMGPLAVGTDGAGSIRIPAAFSGVVGFKPSFGRVPAYPLSPFGTVAHLGPMARSVSDCALMLNVLAQPDARDWTSLPPDARDYTVGLHDGVRGLRIAYSPTLGYAERIDPEVAAAVREAAFALVDLGAQVDQLDPGFADPLDITVGLWCAGSHAVFSGLSSAQQAQVDPDFAQQAEHGARLSVLEVQRLHQRRGELGSHMRQFMQRYDLLITPAVACTAFAATAVGEPPPPQGLFNFTPFSYPFNLTQQPAISVPCGLSREGLPIGLQIVGPMFGDALVLRAARAFESAKPWAKLDTSPTPP
jgi:aspartyl-tRNA(Asn)/glutamyl-tRNA(Gln) amidotransferase subunit A